MKTMKIAVVAMLVIFTLANLSSSAQVFQEKPKFKVGVYITLEKAIKNSGLVRAMYKQILQQDVINSHEQIYVAEVIYNGKIYLISGTVGQWILFFVMDGGGTSDNTMKYRGGGNSNN